MLIIRFTFTEKFLKVSYTIYMLYRVSIVFLKFNFFSINSNKELHAWKVVQYFEDIFKSF